jgi:membrane protein DedA with SNARE-associated domain
MAPIFAWMAHYGYVGIFILLMLGIVGLPVPDETLLIFTGYLVFTRELHWLPTLVTAFAGSICGISVSYSLGRTLGFYLVGRLGRYFHVDAATLERVQAWYQRWGKYTLLFGYFVPGVRHLGAYVAGSSQLPFGVFACFAYTGGLFWSGSFIALGYFFGDEWSRTSAVVHRYLIIAGGGVVVVAGIIVAIARRKRHAAGDRARGRSP